MRNDTKNPINEKLTRMKNMMGIKENSIQESTDLSQYSKFVMFALNFPAGWVEDCFMEKVGKTMTDHLNGKWGEAFSRGGSAGSLIYFYSGLDGTNSRIVDEYISNYYS